MAKLEDLIKQITDPKLRNEIAREAATLKSTKKFGLVFEEHIPEQVQIPGLPVRRGSRVIKRDNGKQVFQVVEIIGKIARLAPEPDGQEETANLDELVIVKRFGEPIYPTLTPRARVEHAPKKPWHTIINADNFHALQLLLYCYEGLVDVIYIDPPIIQVLAIGNITMIMWMIVILGNIANGCLSLRSGLHLLKNY